MGSSTSNAWFLFELTLAAQARAQHPMLWYKTLTSPGLTNRAPHECTAVTGQVEFRPKKHMSAMRLIRSLRRLASIEAMATLPCCPAPRCVRSTDRTDCSRNGRNPWGLGMGVSRVNGHVCVGHTGGGLYAASIYFVPDLKLGVIVLANSEDDELADYRDYAIQLLAPILGGTSPHAGRQLAPELRHFIGLYTAKNHLGRMLVASLDGNLVLLAPDEANFRTGGTLLQTTGETNVFFRREPDAGPSESPGETLSFDVAPDGAITGFHTDSLRYTRIGGLGSQ